MKNINNINNTNNLNNSVSLKNADLMICLGAHKNVVARSFLYTNKNEGLQRRSMKVEDNYDDNTLMYSIISDTLDNCCELDDAKNILIIVPTGIAIKMLEIRKVITSNPSYACDQIISLVVKDWMKRDQPSLAEEIADATKSYYKIIKEGKVNISFFKRHTLDWWELDAKQCAENQIQNGDLLYFEKGVEVETGITSPDNSYLDGEYHVTTRSFMDHNGREMSRYYVARDTATKFVSLKNARRLNEIVNEVLPGEIDYSEEKVIDAEWK